ncbi:MAG: DUF192 domain-containing protein [Gemmatimonadota bacterium]
MRQVELTNVTRDASLGAQIAVADGWWTRLRGLLGRPPLEPGQGMLLSPCHSVHMYGMRQSLDVAFLDRAGRVVAMYPDLPPGRRTRWHSDAHQALELPPGMLGATRTQLGDTVKQAPAGVSAEVPASLAGARE